jgi:hypothetical protein
MGLSADFTLLCCTQRSRRSEASANRPGCSGVVAVKDPKISLPGTTAAQVSQRTQSTLACMLENGCGRRFFASERDLGYRVHQSWAEHPTPRKDDQTRYARCWGVAVNLASSSGISCAAFLAHPLSSAALGPAAAAFRRSIDVHQSRSKMRYRLGPGAPAEFDTPTGPTILASYS